jgi:hypothetical protein
MLIADKAITKRYGVRPARGSVGKGYAPRPALLPAGSLTKSPHAGLPLQSPYLAILNKQAQIMLEAGAELGFSHSSHTRVQVAKGMNSALAWLRDRHNDPDNLTAKPWDHEPEEFFDDRHPGPRCMDRPRICTCRSGDVSGRCYASDGVVKATAPSAVEARSFPAYLLVSRQTVAYSETS